MSIRSFSDTKWKPLIMLKIFISLQHDKMKAKAESAARNLMNHYNNKNKEMLTKFFVYPELYHDLFFYLVKNDIEFEKNIEDMILEKIFIKISEEKTITSAVYRTILEINILYINIKKVDQFLIYVFSVLEKYEETFLLSKDFIALLFLKVEDNNKDFLDALLKRIKLCNNQIEEIEFNLEIKVSGKYRRIGEENYTFDNSNNMKLDELEKSGRKIESYDYDFHWIEPKIPKISVTPETPAT